MKWGVMCQNIPLVCDVKTRTATANSNMVSKKYDRQCIRTEIECEMNLLKSV